MVIFNGSTSPIDVVAVSDNDTHKHSYSTNGVLRFPKVTTLQSTKIKITWASVQASGLHVKQGVILAAQPTDFLVERYRATANYYYSKLHYKLIQTFTLYTSNTELYINYI